MGNYTWTMARGWESKSVEAQQEEALNKPSGKPLLTAEEAVRARELTNLHLSLKRVLEQLAVSEHPRHRTTLELAKNHLEREIESRQAQGSNRQTG
jgi:hypothetical protein